LKLEFEIRNGAQTANDRIPPLLNGEFNEQPLERRDLDVVELVRRLRSRSSRSSA